ncbi:MAG: hypothetical protein ACOC5F_05145 [Candidatus Aminicenantaceae bacterium]
MEKDNKKERIYELVCPLCHSILWIDSIDRKIIKFEKSGGKKRKYWDELLINEKKKKEEMDRKFETTSELEKMKLKKAEEKFKKALSEVDSK